MITLFIDTSSFDVSIAIVRDGQLLASITKTIPNQHSIYTVSNIYEMIKEAKIQPADINQIMVVTGPGSFTGVRIGVTIAKVYAYLLHIHLIEVSSLKMRSISFSHDFCLSVIDARHDHYYVGLYDYQNREVIPEQFCHKDKVLSFIHQYHPSIVGDCSFKIGDYVVEKQELAILEIVNYYGDEEGSNPHFVVPNYLKLPQVLEEHHD